MNKKNALLLEKKIITEENIIKTITEENIITKEKTTDTQIEYKKNKEQTIKEKLYEIRKSEIHNKGAYAIKDIPKGTIIAIYKGEKITKEESEKRANERLKKHKENQQGVAAVYIFELNENYDIDGDVPDNDAKYINHSCDPNCEVDIVNDEIIIYTIKDVKKGEELTFNYGFEFDEEFIEHPCRCGSKNCVGYILAEEEWPKLKEYLSKKQQKIYNNKH
ncbi:MAG: hypothetical protein KatS3mg002_1194 [Candidatus Woesearchaeota archaeon]|nr:MAG: hypothetical protein KatS3mg002_1194 [Candidatus Woesearchaeota archaeon]